MTTPNTPQPPPQGEGQSIASLVRADIDERVAMGLDKYGTLLRAHNGRDAITDAYQEAIDLMFYLRQAITEADGHCSVLRRMCSNATDLVFGIRGLLAERDGR